MDRTAVVTGAGGGIGESVVLRLARDGIRVLAVDVKEAPAALQRASGVEYMVADLTSESAIDAVVSAVGPHLDYLVNAAGVAWFDRDGSVLDIDDTTWHQVMSINLDVMRRMSGALMPALRAGSGKSMVHIASIAGLRSMDSPLDAYQVSKAAVISLSRALALTVAHDGIRSNTVCPGAILTPMIEYLYEEDPSRKTRMEERTPLGRLGRPEDIADAVFFLLSEQASFITGIDLVVDGGWIAQIK